MGRWRTAVAVSAGVAAIILSPILLPIALFLHSRDEKRMRALVAIFPCRKCGRILGADALRIADEAWARHLADVARHAQGGVIRYRLVKNADAICPHCGTNHKFMPKQRSFIAGRREDHPTGSEKPPQAPIA